MEIGRFKADFIEQMEAVYDFMRRFYSKGLLKSAVVLYDETDFMIRALSEEIAVKRDYTGSLSKQIKKMGDMLALEKTIFKTGSVSELRYETYEQIKYIIFEHSLMVLDCLSDAVDMGEKITDGKICYGFLGNIINDLNKQLIELYDIFVEDPEKEQEQYKKEFTLWIAPKLSDKAEYDRCREEILEASVKMQLYLQICIAEIRKKD